MGASNGDSNQQQHQSYYQNRYGLPMVGDSGLLARRLLQFDDQQFLPSQNQQDQQSASIKDLMGQLKTVLPAYADLSVSPSLIHEDDCTQIKCRIVLVNYGHNKPGSSILHSDNRMVADAFVDALVALVIGTWANNISSSSKGNRGGGDGTMNTGRWLVVLTAMSGEDLTHVQELYMAAMKKLEELKVTSSNTGAI